MLSKELELTLNEAFHHARSHHTEPHRRHEHHALGHLGAGT